MKYKQSIKLNRTAKLRSVRLGLLLIGFGMMGPINGFSKGKDSVLITPTTDLGNIGWFDQFTFIHTQAQNDVDRWVKKMKPFGRVDSLYLNKRIHELGATRSKEAYTLLYLCCFQPVSIKHLTAFNGIAYFIGAYGGYQALNTYFLQNAVDIKLSPAQFREEVRKRCAKNHPICYYWIY